MLSSKDGGPHQQFSLHTTKTTNTTTLTTTPAKPETEPHKEPNQEIPSTNKTPPKPEEEETEEDKKEKKPKPEEGKEEEKKEMIIMWKLIKNVGSDLVVAFSSAENGAHLHLEVIMMIDMCMMKFFIINMMMMTE